MNETFNAKAKSFFKSFEGFPKPTHPLWKGFPQNVWMKDLEKLNWRAGLSSGNLNESSLKTLPFETEAFSVLAWDGKSARWIKNPLDSIQIKSYLSTSSFQADNFHKLVGALAQPGIEIEVPKNQKVEQPILLIFDKPEASSWNTLNHKIRMGQGSEMSLILMDSSSSTNGFITHLIGVELEQASSLKMIAPLNVDYVSHSYSKTHFQLAHSSKLEFLDLGIEAGLGRSEVHVDLKAPQAEAKVSTIHLLRDAQVFDTRIKMNHLAEETFSHQNVKCVVADKAHSIFGGNILIEKDAQRVQSAQSHKALILSKGAKSSAFPELEVRADDVKAAHGSSTGQLDKDQIFYLKSRGLKQEEAVHLLSEAFIKDVVLKLSDMHLRIVVDQILAQKLPQFVNQMESKWLEEAK